MFRYHYFIKQVSVPYTYLKKFQCVRIPEGDKELTRFQTLYYPIGWDVFLAYQFAPSKEEEIFKLKLHFQAGNSEFEVQTLEDYKKSTEML